MYYVNKPFESLSLAENPFKDLEVNRQCKQLNFGLGNNKHVFSI